MGELKLRGMTVVKEVETTEDVDLIMHFLVTDPLKITHYINFWRQEAMATTSTKEDKARAEKMVKMWLNYAEKQGEFTTSIYSFDDNEVKSHVDQKSDQVSEDIINDEVINKDETIKPADVKLTIVKDEEVIAPDENRILRVKYADIIKKINVEALKQKCTDLIKANKIDDAKEVAMFILTNGLYTGKKVKQWSKDKVESFLESCKNGKVPTETTTVIGDGPIVNEPTTADIQTSTGESVISEDEDLYKKYVNYVGECAIPLAQLRIETKALLKHGEIEKGMELALFILSEGLTTDGTEKWSESRIEEWFKAIKEELIAEGYEVAIVDLLSEVKERILSTDVTEEEVKKYILDTVKSKRVENLLMYFNVENTQEELESMYTTFFISIVAEAYKEKGIKQVDTKEEIAKYIKKGIDRGEKIFGNAVQSAMILYRQKGEKVGMKEAKEIVYAIAKEKFPEQYAIAMSLLNSTKSADTKVTIIPNDVKLPFPQKYPEVWESIKDTNPESLDDVYQMARELEKTTSFLIVSEMIIHFISSGKIKNKDGILISEDQNTMWEPSMIEMWINNTFKNAETVDEAKDNPVVKSQIVKADGAQIPEDVASLVDPTTPNVSQETLSGQTSPGILETNSMEEVDTVVDTTKVEPVVSTETAPIVLTTVSKVLKNIEIPKAYKIPEDKVPFKDLYALKNADFWDAFTTNILRLEQEGKSKKEIIHTMADVIKAIAMNDDLTQCHARNFKRTNINEMYKVIEAKASKLEIPGWFEVK